MKRAGILRFAASGALLSTLLLGSGTPAAAICAYAASPSSVSLASAATVGAIEIAAAPGCVWEATASDPWITVISGASGTGPGVIGYRVEANRGASARSGSILVGDAAVSIEQERHPLVVEFVGLVGGEAQQNPSGARPLTVTFDAGGSQSVEPITGYRWDFGDGTTANTAAATVEHTYEATGSYIVALSVVAGHRLETANRIVTVAEQVHQVSSGAQLQAALAAAQSNGLDDLIRISTDFPISENGGEPFTYVAAAGEDKDLAIEGGWGEDFAFRVPGMTWLFNDSECTPLADPFGAYQCSTVYTASGDGALMRIDASNTQTGSISLDALALRDGKATGAGGCLFAVSGGPIRISDSYIAGCSAATTGGGAHLQSGSIVELQRVMFEGNEAASGGGAAVTAHSARIFNTDVDHNTADRDSGLTVQVQTGGELVAGNNSIYWNSTRESDLTDTGGAGLIVDVSGSAGTALVELFNNYLYDNWTGPDLVVRPDCAELAGRVDLRVHHNDLDAYAICADYSLDPSNISYEALQLSLLNYFFALKAPDAPLIDTGSSALAPPTDSERDRRPIDGRIGAVADIGSDEYDPLNPDGVNDVVVTPERASLRPGERLPLTVRLERPVKHDTVFDVKINDVWTYDGAFATVTPSRLLVRRGQVTPDGGATILVTTLKTVRRGMVSVEVAPRTGNFRLPNGGCSVSLSSDWPSENSLIGPSGVVATATPTVTWLLQPSQGLVADAFDIRVYDWLKGRDISISSNRVTLEEAGCASGPGATCSFTLTTPIPRGKWLLVSVSALYQGYGVVYPTQPRSIYVPPLPPPPGPSAVALYWPAGTSAETKPVYSWGAQPGATAYRLWVGKGATTVYSATYTPEAAGCTVGTGPCSVRPATSLAPGDWFFNVRATEGALTGPWAVAQKFSVHAVPPAVTLLSPSGTIYTQHTGLLWQPLPGVEYFEVEVFNDAGEAFSPPYAPFEPATVCWTGACSAHVSDLAYGAWNFKVRAISAAGIGPWSAPMRFTVEPPPAATNVIAPYGSGPYRTPTYTWYALSGAASYQLWVGTASSAVLTKWYTAAEAGCASGTGVCNGTPTTELTEGTWFANVRVKMGDGTVGPWGTIHKFVYTEAQPLPRATLLSPSGDAGTATPTFTWAALPGAGSYQLWVGTGASTAVSVWVTPAEAGCGSGGSSTCSLAPGTSLTTGYWYFNVRGKNAYGTAPWATRAMYFTVP